MKKSYKYLAILMFSLSAIIMVFVLKNSFALPDNDCDSNSNYCIKWDEDNLTATLTKYQGTDTEVVVPATLTKDNKTYSVIVVGGAKDDAPLFAGNSNITKITFENGVKAGSTLNYAFYNCINLEEINFNNFDTSDTTAMGAMFYSNIKLTELDLHMFDTSKVTTMGNMFYNCRNLEKLDMSSFTSESLTNIHYMFFTTTALRWIKIGNNFDFLYPSKYAYDFGRGTWKRLEDGKNYSVADLVYYSKTKDISGTYEKQSNIAQEMFVDYNVKFKIDPITKFDEYSFSDDNLFMVNDNILYAKITNQITTADYVVPGSATILAKNIVSDAQNNKYNLRITIDNIHLYDLNFETVEFNHYIAGAVSNALAFRSYNYKSDLSGTLYGDCPSKYDVTLEVVNNNGVVQEGDYVFAAEDLDIPAYTGRGRAEKSDPDGKYKYSTNTGWGEYSEGINLLEGYYDDTYKVFPVNFVEREGNRIFGYRYDEGSEFTEFNIKVNAKKFKFTWTGEDCGTAVLRYYQPTFVNIIKQDNSGNNLSGAKLKLYAGDTLIDSWTSTNEAHTLFLNGGYYTLKETEAPNNYNKASDLSFYVDVNGKIVINGKEEDNVIFKNTPIPFVRVIVKYIDEDTNEELAKITDDGKRKGETYTSVEKTFDGYILTRKPESETVTLNQDETVLIYYYHRVVYITTEVKGEGGTIKGDETVNYHNDSTPDNIVIEADKDYFIDKITINNIEVEVTNDKKMILPNFTNMEENKHIVVSFVPLTPDVPKTDINTILPILGVVMLILGIVFVYIGKKNKPKKVDNTKKKKKVLNYE